MEKDFIYLASASPRRAELLRQLGIAFQVRPADLDERRRAGETPAHYVERTAADKATAVSGALSGRDRHAAVLGADTIVVVDGAILGKPAGEHEAARMLERLSGTTHDVLSAVAVTDGASTQTALNASKVRFRATTAREREAYCATGEPFDKAGAYGIQGLAAAFIERLEGSYSAVMGLPLFETAELLARFALPGWLHAAPPR